MELDDLFSSALVAIGPPFPMPRITRDGSPTPLGVFNNSVREYNDFLRHNGVLIDVACSYQAFSAWFHD